MVVVLVVWAKTGAALIAREAAIKRVSAGFLRMQDIVARLVLAKAARAINSWVNHDLNAVFD